VDELGGYPRAIELAAELADLGDDFAVDYPESQMGISEALGLRVRASLAKAVAPLLPRSALPTLPAAMTPVVAEIRRIERLTDPRNLYSYCLACRVE
jgi:hypothetical protein